MSDISESDDPAVPAPEPPAAGAEGTQEAAASASQSLILSGPVATPVDQRHLGATLRDFADARSVAVGTIAVAAFQDAVETKAALTARVTDLQRELSVAQERFHEERELRLLAEERLATSDSTQTSSQIALIAGSLVAGAGLPPVLQAKSLNGQGGLLLAIGIVLVGVGLSITHRSTSPSQEPRR